MELQPIYDSYTAFSECEEEEETSKPQVPNRKNSFVWKYFRCVDDNEKSYECIICNACVGHQTSNLARHLASAHDITKQGEQGIEDTGRGRPSRSFIWKYCTKEDAKHARCHLCNKVLYFGGGNTANISKHLRRKHPNLFLNMEQNINEDTEAVRNLNNQSQDMSVNNGGGGGNSNNVSPSMQIMGSERRERKGGSYVWNYCDKLSRHTIRCRLCNKVMSFHGTANVITHLQRKHNIVGKLDNTTTVINSSDAALVSEDVSEHMDESDSFVKRRSRNLPSSTSIVWKYCTRVGKDLVRCGFCKKNLSYQGTSNLQRHLHRMHGVVTQGRLPKYSNEAPLSYKFCDTNFILEHCTLAAEGKTNCSMCSEVFDYKNTDEIIKHLTITHAIKPQRPDRRQKRKRDESDDETSDDYDGFDTDNWSKHDGSENIAEFDETNIKKDESLFDEIIEEENEHANCDEEPFDPNMLHDIPLANPLSPQSSPGASPDMAQRVVVNGKVLQRLTEERVKMETEYFREKAGFYRMQKYLTALQAKKVRIEIERINNGVLNDVYTADDSTHQNLTADD